MPYSVEAAVAQVQEHFKTVNSLVHEIENERLKEEKTLSTISMVQEKIIQDGRLTANHQQKLKGLYMNAVKDATNTEELLRKALTKINEIRNICNEMRLQSRNIGHREIYHRGILIKKLQVTAQTLPLWVGKLGSKTPPLCGAIPADPNYIAKPGDMVVALVRNIDVKEENWILAEVVSFNITNKKYEVYDIDDEQKEIHVLSRKNIVPLPLMRANPATDSHALFPKGAFVMALFPKTTCFYQAKVNKPPSTPLEDYEVFFVDDAYTDGFAPPMKAAQRYVIDMIDKKKKIVTFTGSDVDVMSGK